MQIEIYHSKLLIKGYHLNDIPNLEKALSVWDKVNFCYTTQFFYYDELEETLEIPSGINLDKYASNLKDLGWDGNFIDKKTRLNKINKGFPTIKISPNSPMQNKAIKFLTDNKPYDLTYQKLLALPTGKGKTYCAINASIKMNLVPLVFVDQNNIMVQWKEAVKKFTSIKEEEIYLISGYDTIKKLLKMTKKEIDKFKFFICINRTMKNLLENNEKDFYDFFNKTKIGLKMFDEAHVEWENIFRMDCNINLPSWYITATPARSSYIEDKVYQFIYSKINKLVVKNDIKYINSLIYKINTKPDLVLIGQMQTRYGFDGNKFSKYINERDYDVYLKLILKILFGTFYNFKKPKEDQVVKKTAIVFHLNSTLVLFYNDLTKVIKANNLPHTIGILNGTIKKQEEKDKVLKETDIILTTGKSFQKAIDVKDLEILINTVAFSSNTMTKQMFGRLRFIENKDLYFIDIINIGYPQCKEQLRKKNKVYKDLSLAINEIDI